jgi:thiamine-phosphate pyrophosphorylase
MLSPGQPILCYVTDRRSLAQRATGTLADALQTKIAQLLAAGVDWIQIREKDLPGGALSSLAGFALKAASAQTGPINASNTPKILVNDRLDVALAMNAGGVHLGESSLPVAAAKKLIGAQTASAALNRAAFLAGASCHSLAAAGRAAEEGADYLIFGPVFSTPSKAGFGAPQGLAKLEEVCRGVSIPVLAIGGITLENAASCIAAGASGIAAIRLFQDAADPAHMIEALRNSFDSR